ncbi:MAG: response regulator transcription factor [Candidatus Metalachnospira sp.]|nr:response regulator transcription factor [Candidatus Metalachnospira sp.]
MPYKILVVDDEKLIVKGIKFSLEQDEMNIDVAYDGEEALNLIKKNKYDLAVLDVMLPKMDGLHVCREVREFSSLPIIMVTAKGEDMDKIMGLEYGADDYMTKPFNILELKARIKAVLRRSAKQTAEKTPVKNEMTVRDLYVELDSRRVFVDSKEAYLTAKEFDLLELLMKTPGKVYSREKLLDTVWGFDYPGDVRTVDVHVRRLREKIEKNPSAPEYIFTKWGVGYYFG